MRIHRYIYTLLAIIALASCSSDEELSKVDAIGNDNPMRFGTANAQEGSTISRASTLLEAGFKVSAYKSFGDATKQQVVMDGYKVDYNSTTKKWNYVDVDKGDGKKQIERYWDADGYPYDFRACTPYLTGASLTNTGITLDLTATDAPTFKAQTFLEDATTKVGKYNQDEKSSEACLISHVQRKAPTTDAPNDYCDYDLLRPTDDANYEINKASKTPTREVHMPFHHLMSKVGFRFFIDDPSVPTYNIHMKDVTISIVTEDANKFILESKKYTYTNNSNLLEGTFSELTNSTNTHVHDSKCPSGCTATIEQPLITKTETYKDDSNNDLNMGEYLNHDHAFDFKCGGDMVQIPQTNLKIHVKLTLEYNESGTPTIKTFDSYLNVDDTDTDAGQKFTWEPNKHYVYYLHLKNLEKYPIITCTAELVPWDIVKTEDIDIGL